MRDARNRNWGNGDIVNYEYVAQAQLNPKWGWTDNTHWSYTQKNLHYVPSRDRARDSDVRPTIPAVYTQRRWGIVGAVCDNQPFRGPKLQVFPLFTYDHRGLQHPDGDLQNAPFSVEHLQLMHHDDALDIEQRVSEHNRDPANSMDPKFLDKYSNHPYVPWGRMLRGNHKCPKGTFVRLTSANEVYMNDPRVELVGKLNEASRKIFQGVMLKVQEMLSTDPKDRRDVDVSKYPWLAYLDRFSAERRQEYADRNTASEQTDSQTQTKKRTISEVDESSPSPSSPVGGTQDRVGNAMSMFDSLSPEERLTIFEHISKRLKLDEDLEDGEIPDE